METPYFNHDSAVQLYLHADELYATLTTSPDAPGDYHSAIAPLAEAVRKYRDLLEVDGQEKNAVGDGDPDYGAIAAELRQAIHTAEKYCGAQHDAR